MSQPRCPPLRMPAVNISISSHLAYLRTRRVVQLCAGGLFSIALFASMSVRPADQKSEIYQVRLSPLGVTNATVDTTTGAGKATATLTGNRLTIEGSFDGLTGAATAANLRRGPKGIPGPVVFDISVPKSSSGQIDAAFELTADQLKDLREARLYLQIHSERAPDGSIRGWLLTAKR
jgi:CHRD domain